MRVNCTLNVHKLHTKYNLHIRDDLSIQCAFYFLNFEQHGAETFVLHLPPFWTSAEERNISSTEDLEHDLAKNTIILNKKLFHTTFTFSLGCKNNHFLQHPPNLQGQLTTSNAHATGTWLALATAHMSTIHISTVRVNTLPAEDRRSQKRWKVNSNTSFSCRAQ